MTQGPSVVPELAKLLEHSDPNVAEAAADVLQSIGSEDAFDALVDYGIRILQQQLDWHSPQARKPPFVRTRTKAGYAVIKRRFEREKSPSTRELLFCASQRPYDEWESFLRLALQDENELIAAWAAVFIGFAKYADSCAILVDVMKSAGDLRRVGVIHGLRYLEDVRAVESLFSVAEEPLIQNHWRHQKSLCLRPLLTHTDTVQDEAAWAVIDMLGVRSDAKSPDANKRLREWTMSGDGRRVRERYKPAKAVKGPHGDAFLPSFVPACPNPNPKR